MVPSVEIFPGGRPSINAQGLGFLHVHIQAIQVMKLANVNVYAEIERVAGRKSVSQYPCPYDGISMARCRVSVDEAPSMLDGLLRGKSA